MTDITVLDNTFASVVYHKEKGIIHHTFRRPVTGESFRNVLETGVACMKQNGATKWLSDDRLNSQLSEDDTDWATQTWFQMAQAAGWKTWALVVPEDLYARLNLIEHVNHYSSLGIRVMVFTKLEEAFDWLDQIKG